LQLGQSVPWFDEVTGKTIGQMTRQERLDYDIRRQNGTKAGNH
jgi:hypothetical protein